MQFGALVSDRVAVNGGIAKGFNKGGKTALRAGFTFGW
jgi:GT2 family glycosyltransferase